MAWGTVALVFHDHKLRTSIVSVSTIKFPRTHDKSIAIFYNFDISQLLDHDIEIKIKVLQTKLYEAENIKMYNSAKQKLERIVDEMVQGNRIRPRRQWFKKGGKSNKFFLNLEKSENFRSNAKRYSEWEKNFYWKRTFNREIENYIKLCSTKV